MHITKKWKSILLLLGFFLVLGVGEQLGWLEFSFGSWVVSQDDRVEHARHYENITGTLLIWPWDVWKYFSDALSQTQNILYLETYDFTEKRVKKIFRDLLASGVDIKMIMENKKYRQYKDTFVQVGDDFADFDNFQLKSDYQMKTKYVHSKFTLLDNAFWIQTANLNHSSFFKNREYFFVSNNTGVYHSLKTIFEKDRIGAKIWLEDIHPNLLVCNINCRPVIQDLLSSATKSIIIETQYITDDAILQILKNKARKEDMDIKLILADTDSNTDVLDYFGHHMARTLKKTYNHSKMMLIDGKTLLLWSMNFSSNSLDHNRELGIILTDQSVIQKFLWQFWKDWK